MLGSKECLVQNNSAPKHFRFTKVWARNLMSKKIMGS